MRLDFGAMAKTWRYQNNEIGDRQTADAKRNRNVGAQDDPVIQAHANTRGEENCTN